MKKKNAIVIFLFKKEWFWGCCLEWITTLELKRGCIAEQTFVTYFNVFVQLVLQGVNSVCQSDFSSVQIRFSVNHPKK